MSDPHPPAPAYRQAGSSWSDEVNLILVPHRFLVERGQAIAIKYLKKKNRSILTADKLYDNMLNVGG